MPLSPGSVKVRTECIDQLRKWHSLLGEGIITQADYDKIQGTILKDMMWVLSPYAESYQRYYTSNYHT